MKTLTPSGVRRKASQDNATRRRHLQSVPRLPKQQKLKKRALKQSTTLRLDPDLLQWIQNIADSRKVSSEQTTTWVIEYCLQAQLPILDPDQKHKPKKS